MDNRLNGDSQYLEKHIFEGLKNLNTGFDAPGIRYFSEYDFEILLNRVQEKGIVAMGIEPWKDGKFYDVDCGEDFSGDPDTILWYFKSFEKYRKLGETLQYSASLCLNLKIEQEDKKLTRKPQPRTPAAKRAKI